MLCPAILAGGRVRLFAMLVGNGLGQAAASLGTALLVRSAFDALMGATPLGPASMLPIGAGLAFLAAVLATLRHQERLEAERLGQSYTHEVRLLLFRQLSGTAPRALQARGRGGILLRFVGDLTALRQWVSLGLARLTVASATVLGALAALAWSSAALALAIGTVLLLSAASAYVAGRFVRPAIREARRRHAHLAANIGEKLSAMPVVQLFGQAEREERRLARQASRYSAAMVGRARATGRLRAITEAAHLVALMAVLLTGIHEVAAGRITPGGVVGAMTMVGLVLPALRDLGRAHEYWHSAKVSTGRIEEFLSAPAPMRKPGLPKLAAERGAITLEGVGVTGLFQGLDLHAPAGARVAIVGPNGSGKTTLLWLIAGLIRPDEGTVLIDGHNLAEHSPASVRRAVGMVSPDLPLLKGSVSRNLRYRRPRTTPAELARLCALCELDDLIAALPNGLQTRIVEGGVNLSLGQRQRIMLARALLGSPPVLLLDEVDAHLDAEARDIVDRVIGSYRGTVLTVTHRRERVLRSDLVWHLGSGRMVEVGSPAAVLEGRGATAGLLRDRAQPSAAAA